MGEGQGQGEGQKIMAIGFGGQWAVADAGTGISFSFLTNHLMPFIVDPAAEELSASLYKVVRSQSQ